VNARSDTSDARARLLRPAHEEEHPRLVFGCQQCIDRVTVASHESKDDDGDARRAKRSERDRQRTQAQHALLAQGIHPATRRPLADNDETCGSCTFFQTYRKGGTYFKCSNEHGPGVTFGPATDIRKTWPACELWEAVS